MTEQTVTEQTVTSSTRRSERTRLATLTVAIVLIAGTVGCSGSPTSAPVDTGRSGHPDAVAVTTTGATRDVPDRFFGFNAASIVQTVNADLLRDPALQDELAGSGTRLLRVPTGTAAQWIDWRTGAFIENPTSPFASIPPDRRGMTMDDWAELIARTGAEPVWDLNVLNADLDDQIEMLTEAERLGMPVRFIELGNELWDVRSIYPEVYPTGADYAETMNAWIPALRERFGDVHIAVCGADPSDAFFAAVFGDRYVDWNRQVVDTVVDADAITIHPYWTLPDRAEPGSDVAATLDAGPDAWDAVTAETLARVPDDLDVWVTEWNQAAWGSDSGTQIWAQALSVVTVAIAQLVDPRIGMSLVHDIVDGHANPHDVGISTTFPAFTNGADGSEPLARTALGHALPLLFDAVGPGTSVTRLALDDPGVASGFAGVAIAGANPGAVFVNRSAEPVTVDAGDVLPGTWTTTVLSAAPDAQPGWVASDTVDPVTGSTDGVIEIPAHALVRLARP